MKRRARQPAATTCKPQWYLVGLLFVFEPSREGKSPEALQRVDNFAHPELRRRRFLIAGPRTSGKTGGSAYPPRTARSHSKPAPGRLGSPPGLSSQNKNEQHRLVLHLARLRRHRVDVEPVAVQRRFESRRNCLPLTSNVIGGALSAGPASASPEAFGVRAGPLDTVVLAEIGAPSAVA